MNDDMKENLIVYTVIVIIVIIVGVVMLAIETYF